MTNEEMYQRMLTLTPQEKIARKFYETYGTYLNFPQFLLTYQYPKEDFLPEYLLSAEGLLRQQRLHAQFSSSYGKNLSEDTFMTDGREIEVEQLLRYIDTPAHQHDFTEFVVVLEGYCDHVVGTQTYRHQKGSFAIIVAGIEHYLKPSPDCLCVTIKIRQQTLHTINLPNFPHFVYPISFQVGNDPFIPYVLIKMYAQQTDQLPYFEQIMLLLFQTLMVYLCQNYWDTLQHLAPHTVYNKQMLEITNYIFENYQTVSLASLAREFHFNPSYLSTLIKRQTGSSFTEILKNIRLKHAARLLSQTSRPINHICSDIGYQDVSQFISMFRNEYGMTPVQYRRKFIKEAI